jgi:hypothetical protein
VNRLCVLSACRICRQPGPVVCAATARAISEEDNESDKAATHDAHRTRMWAERPPRDFGYFDVRDPYPLRQDPAFDPS